MGSYGERDAGERSEGVGRGGRTRGNDYERHGRGDGQGDADVAADLS